MSRQINRDERGHSDALFLSQGHAHDGHAHDGHAHDGHAHRQNVSGSSEPLPEPPGVGAVVLDIGGEIGAAIISAPSRLGDQELEVRPLGAAWDGTHVAVRECRLPGGTRWAALFGSLRQGSYETRLKGDGASPVLVFEVTGGRVTAADWPEP
ncbi:MAG TPA: hypothetical protein VMS00_07845 [Acidimicrobiales bacterium]|nr:hypothetical protein [Acidimicrobiales bacterium]